MDRGEKCGFKSICIHIFIIRLCFNRNCIGLRLGKMQAQVGLVIMLKNFRYELDDSLKGREMEFEIKGTLLASRAGIKMKVFQI